MPDIVVCRTEHCGHEFGSYPTGMEPAEQRSPCPKCDGLSRMVRKNLSVTGTARASVAYAARPPGRRSNRSRFAWGLTGWDYSRRIGRFVLRASHFDKRSDRRLEHIEDPKTGEVLHHEDHPLTEHRGHGSDKAARPPGVQPQGKRAR